MSPLLQILVGAALLPWWLMTTKKRKTGMFHELRFERKGSEIAEKAIKKAEGLKTRAAALEKELIEKASGEIERESDGKTRSVLDLTRSSVPGSIRDIRDRADRALADADRFLCLSRAVDPDQNYSLQLSELEALGF